MLESFNDVNWLRLTLLSLTSLRLIGTFITFIPTFAFAIKMKSSSYILNKDTCTPDECFWYIVFDLFFLYLLTIFIPNLLGTVNDYTYFYYLTGKQKQMHKEILEKNEITLYITMITSFIQ